MANTYITVDELKEHLNIEPDYTDEEGYLKSLISVAEMAVFNYCNGGLPEVTTVEIEGVQVIALPKTIKQAILLLAAHYYVNRTPVAFTSATELPYTFQFLLNPYKNFVVV